MTPEQVRLRSLNYGRGFLLSLAAALLLLAGLECPAAGPRFDVFPGYGNNFIVPDQGWFPITCELQNDGPAFNAIIEISAAQMGRGQTRRVQGGPAHRHPQTRRHPRLHRRPILERPPAG